MLTEGGGSSWTEAFTNKVNMRRNVSQLESSEEIPHTHTPHQRGHGHIHPFIRWLKALSGRRRGICWVNSWLCGGLYLRSSPSSIYQPTSPWHRRVVLRASLRGRGFTSAVVVLDAHTVDTAPCLQIILFNIVVIEGTAWLILDLTSYGWLWKRLSCDRCDRVAQVSRFRSTIPLWPHFVEIENVIW